MDAPLVRKSLVRESGCPLTTQNGGRGRMTSVVKIQLSLVIKFGKL